MKNDSLSAYLGWIGSDVTLDPATELELAERYRAGDRRAGDALVHACLPFVISIATGYRAWGVPLEDLVQQGNIGLVKAAQKFDPEQKCRLATYASYWIRAEIRAYVLKNHRAVRLGSTYTERKAIRALRTRPIADAEELARESGMPEKRAAQLWSLLAQSEVPLDASTPSGIPRSELIGDESQEGPDRLAERSQLRAQVGQRLPGALAELDARERRVLEARLLSESPPTLRELARTMGLSRERVRQLEHRGRAKLRVAFADLAA